ncbi:MAG: hypothetical protein IKA36_00765 [Clostridia bacterium]|nr:hypothetical protein [Clostridia bacterium]
MNIFNKVYDFLDSFSGTLSYNYIFLFSVGLFTIVAFSILISTSKSYESKLVKAIDMFNTYFAEYPQINDETLVMFNNKMKSNKVPRLLRKQWQQYVLYRDKKASDYMSFELCVSEPIKNSSFKRDITTLNIITYITAVLALLFNLFESYQQEVYTVFKYCLITPLVILLLNFIVTIFLNVRHNAIVSDLQTSYQYFEVNIDKATKTLPEYIDYEVLFDREEIKQGIPILYAYLQKRADEEQKELERARLKNVEHEKFNFDESGVESALVLERAMQEAENYIAERKKLMEDIEQINADIAQEDLNFREITKEYQRQMQVSKETFANFKAQLEEETSTISINYLKKQQQQELDRQRNLERDYDTASDRHKKVNDEYLAELKSVEEEIADARKDLEEAMMSEFATYSAKVYKEAEKVAAEREASKTNKLKGQIEDLEEVIVSKDNEINDLYNKDQSINEKINAITDRVGEAIKSSVNDKPEQQTINAKKDQFGELKQKVADARENDNLTQEDEEDDDIFNNSFFDDEEETVQTPITEEPEYEYRPPIMVDEQEPEQNDLNNQQSEATEEDDDFDFDEEIDEFEFKFEDDEDEEDEQEGQEEGDSGLDELFNEESIEDSVDKGETTEEVSTTKVESKPKGKRGRPRKVVTETKVAKSGKRPGRPRKTESKIESKPKGKRGRPRKVEATKVVAKKKGPGRPKKVETTKTVKSSKGPGRPRKIVSTETITNKKGPGRPKKTTVQPVQTGKRRGRPRKTEITSRAVDLDKVLKEINDAIAIENSKIEKSKKALEKKTKISKRK